MRFSKAFQVIFFVGVSGLVCVSNQGWAQRAPAATTTSSSATGNIRGKVLSPDGRPIHHAVRVTRQDLRGVPTAIYTDNEGTFEMRGLSPGEYTLEADGDYEKYESGSVRVEVGVRGVTFTTINLRSKANSPSAESGKGTITVGESDPDIPRAATREFEIGTKLSRDGQHANAIQHFRNAISIYPKYLMAHNDLGSELLALGKLAEAEAEIRVATEIDSKAFNPRLNLGIVLYQQRKFADALDALNRAISSQSDSAPARFHRGLVFLALQDQDNAISDLKASHDFGGAQYSLALFLLGRIYFDRGERKLAFESFQKFLQEAPTADNAAEARKMLDLLR